MNYHKRKRDALLMAPQTERGYLRKAVGTPTLSLCDAYPDPFRTLWIEGKHEIDPAVSFPVREHTLTAEDTRALTAVFTATFLCDSVAGKTSGMEQIGFATPCGYETIPVSSLGEAILSANHHVFFRGETQKAEVYAASDAAAPAKTIATTRISRGAPLPDNMLDITELCVIGQSYPAADAIPAGTPVYWSEGDTVLRLTTAGRSLKTGEILCAETFDGVRKVTLGREVIASEASALPAVTARCLESATLTRQMIKIPRLQYTYYGLAEPGEEFYYFALEEGYVILPQELVTDTGTRYVYDTFERVLTAYTADSEDSYWEIEDGFWRANELPAGMDQTACLLSVSESVVSYGETPMCRYPSYSFSGKAGTEDDVFCVSTLGGNLCIDGSVIQEGAAYVYDSRNFTLTRTPKAGGTAEQIPPSLYRLCQDRPAGSIFIPCTSFNYGRTAEGWPGGRPCFLRTKGGRRYTFTPNYQLRPGVVITLDEEAMTVSCSNGFAFPVSDITDSLLSDIANSPNLSLTERQRKCVLLSGDSRSYTASTPTPTHPASFRAAGGCTLSCGRKTFSLPKTAASTAPSAAFLLAGDDISRDRFVKDEHGNVFWESRIGLYTFTGKEVPVSVTAAAYGYAVSYALPDGLAADGEGIFCTRFGLRNVTGDVTQSVFCLESGTAKVVFLLHKSEFPAADEEEAARNFIAFLAACAAGGQPVGVLFRRATPQIIALTTEAAAFSALAPARGADTLSFAAPEGGILPHRAEAVYYSRAKGN